MFFFSSYNVSFMILTYFLPMAIMTALYAAIGRELWGQKAIGEATAVQVESIKSKRRVSCNHLPIKSATTFLEKWKEVVREKCFEKSGSRNLVQEIWFEKSGSRKVVDQKKKWFYTINPQFFRLEKSGWPEKKSEFEEPLF